MTEQKLCKEEQSNLLTAAREGDKAAKERFAESNFGLVHSIAHRFVGRGTSYDDLFQIGCIGLIKAIERYDPSFGTAFSTYAVPLIMGEIRKFFREDGAVKVGRTMREQAAKLAAAREYLSTKFSREPTLWELAEATEITPEEAAAALAASAEVLSLSAPCGEEGQAPEEKLGEDNSDVLCEQIALREAMRELPERERKLLAFRFFAGKTQCETAEKMNISQVQVSRLEKKILEKLRKRME